ncbi:hypothetical protein KKF34_03465 [Myxococcota bacterium]|nr:hypothetical protein [Myxococcota bacterium]MBU1382150.1 hypothetical protein [Myxococcota bacterium]MBU1495915.1 hypothetical protein [Myxococcota bacterium]
MRTPIFFAILIFSKLNACSSTTTVSNPATRLVTKDQLIMVGPGLALPVYETAKYYGKGPAWPVINQVRIYLNEINITQLSSGHKVEHSIPHGYPVTHYELEMQIKSSLIKNLGKCYRWAAWNKNMTGDVNVQMEIEPDGSVSKAIVKTDINNSNRLSDCVKKMILAFHLNRFPYRKTLANIVFRFKKSGQPPPVSGNTEPVPRSFNYQLPHGVYIKVLKKLPIDFLKMKYTFEVDDFDEDWGLALKQQKYDEDFRKAMDDWVQKGRVGNKPVRRRPITIRSGKASCGCSLGGYEAKFYVKSNEGAYSDCYNKALKRDPALTGKIDFKSVFDAGGNLIPQILKSDISDTDLTECVLKELSEVVFPPRPFLPYNQMHTNGLTLFFTMNFKIDKASKIEMPKSMSLKELETSLEKALKINDYFNAYALLKSISHVSSPEHSCIYNVKMFDIIMKFIHWSDFIAFNNIDRIIKMISKLKGQTRQGCLTEFSLVLSRYYSGLQFEANSFKIQYYKRIYYSGLNIKSKEVHLENYASYLFDNREYQASLDIWESQLKHLRTHSRLIEMRKNPDKYSQEIDYLSDKEDRAIYFIQKIKNLERNK